MVPSPDINSLINVILMLKQLAVGGVSALLLAVPGVSIQVNPSIQVELTSVAASAKPVVAITKPPLSSSSLLNQTVEFTATASTAVWYQCSIDSEVYKKCTSPHTVTVSSYGSHTFRVRAVDAYFRVSNPVEALFQVVQPSPSTSPVKPIFYNLDRGTSFVIQGTSFEVSKSDAGEFSICVENVTPQVTFTSPLGTQFESASPFCLAGDDSSDPNPVSLGVGTHTITISDRDHSTPFILTMIVKGESTPPPSGGGPTTIIPAVFPNTSDGKPISQLGLSGWNYWNFEEPFINLTKANAGWAARGGSESMTFADLWKAGYIDKTTLNAKSVPTNMTLYGGRYRHGAYVIPKSFSGTFVAEWEGDADVSLGAPECTATVTINCQKRVSANRLEATFDNTNTSILDWSVSRIGAAGLKNIRIYRKQHEALLNSGKILNPTFVAHAKRYKVLRFLDVQNASQFRPFHAGDFGSASQAFWGLPWMPDAKAQDAPTEISFETIFRVAVETDTAAWITVAGLPGAPASFNALVEPANPELLRNACKNNLTTILASSDWAAYTDGIVNGLKNANYPSNRMLYVEGWNEVWNWGGPWSRMTHCAQGVYDALNGPERLPWRYGYGYLAAHVMVEMDKAFQRAGRTQAWTLALAGQMAYVETTPSALEGFKRYFVDRGMDPAPWLRHAGVSTASYYDGVFDPLEGMFPVITSWSEWTDAKQIEHRAKWKNAILADASGLAKKRTDWTINDTKSSSVANLVKWRADHQRSAESYGAYFLGDYEGESHERLPGYLSADSTITNWAEEYIIGSEGERVTRAWATALQLQNAKAIIANYYSITPRDLEGPVSSDTSFSDPWFDGYYGDSSGRTRGLESILR